MGLFDFAHSLGFPHPDLMLRQMTARQYQELLIYFEVKEKQRAEAERLKAEGEAEAEEANTLQELARQAAKPKG